ncbi:MAG: NADH-quinone oxidoreductase subunit L [Piscirickettsiaceae bacterium]|nr:NADH-quinone oxidoreductase subunit L [Piscirickettsiaceae bacterium]
MNQNLLLIIVLAPLLGSIISGLLGKQVGRMWSHRVAIAGVGLAFIISIWVFKLVVFDDQTYNGQVYQWMQVGSISFEIGFLIDSLTAIMILVVTFVSLMVHIYTIGYMHHDDGYTRFFSYISLFTFSMLMLVMSNNFMQLFFGWEAVGLISYLLIGFWYKKPMAIYANLKAFLVNRIGDFGFLLGIAAVLMYAGSLDYVQVFIQAPEIAKKTISIFSDVQWSVMSLTCILLFIGAMGKSAQVPLHVWLPDSMEGPTPISALIHAATMVTAGIFMVTRMSPLFEFSDTALSVILVVGATTAIFMGFMGLVQNDIKRVIAYSTLSQLGYMTVALGASAYAAGMFHLMTHAFFKALLFLAAGSVMISLNHEQDIRKMGGLRKYLPITYWTSLIGSLAIIGFPGMSGFFSKDLIIESEHISSITGHDFAYFAILISVFITALYSFRLFFLVFHGQEHFTLHNGKQLHEPSIAVRIPLILLAIPSAVGGMFIGSIVFGDFFDGVILVLPEHNVLAYFGEEYHGLVSFILHGLMTTPFLLALLGVSVAYIIYVKRPNIAVRLRQRFTWFHKVLVNKYGFDNFNDKVLAGGSRLIARVFWKIGDLTLIDGVIVNGSAKIVGLAARMVRHIQTGYLYHYAFAMILGVWLLLTLFVV